MELLQKTTSDNSDKKQLLLKTRHPRKAGEIRRDWGFVKSEVELNNISYQIQYLEFNVYLYNDYQIYLTVESLLCKNLLMTMAGIIECALYDLVARASRGSFEVGERRDFAALIKFAHEMGYINDDLKFAFHGLRQIRNLVHLTGTTFDEHESYKIELVNKYIKILEMFRKNLNK